MVHDEKTNSVLAPPIARHARILHPRVAVYYRVDRTYVTDPTGQAAKQDDPPHFVAGGSAGSVARDFIDQESAHLLGAVTELTGDKAMATASREGRVFVVFVQRGAEAPPRL